MISRGCCWGLAGLPPRSCTGCRGGRWGRGAEPAPCLQVRSSSRLGGMWFGPSGMFEDPENILRGREHGLKLFPAIMATAGAWRDGAPGAPLAQKTGPPCLGPRPSAEARLLKQLGTAGKWAALGQGMEGAGCRVCCIPCSPHPLHHLQSTATLASLASFAGRCIPYILLQLCRLQPFQPSQPLAPAQSSQPSPHTSDSHPLSPRAKRHAVTPEHPCQPAGAPPAAPVPCHERAHAPQAGPRCTQGGLDPLPCVTQMF